MAPGGASAKRGIEAAVRHRRWYCNGDVSPAADLRRYWRAHSGTRGRPPTPGILVPKVGDPAGMRFVYQNRLPTGFAWLAFTREERPRTTPRIRSNGGCVTFFQRDVIGGSEGPRRVGRSATVFPSLLSDGLNFCAFTVGRAQLLGRDLGAAGTHFVRGSGPDLEARIAGRRPLLKGQPRRGELVHEGAGRCTRGRC